MLEMGSALDTTICSTFFKKCDSQLITYTSVPSKIQIDYVMIGNKDRKRVRVVKVILEEEVVQQHQVVLCDIMIRVVKEVVKPFLSKRKAGKLKEDATRMDLKKEKLAGIFRCYLWLHKEPPRHRVTW